MRALLIISILLLSFIHYSFSVNYDGIILLSFKLSIFSDPLHVLDNWIAYDATPCSWRGIVCSNTTTVNTSPFFPPSESPRVVQVSLPGSQLGGSLPANIGLLDRLQTLNLSSNSINGSLPGTLFSLPDLHVLDFSNNSISGQVADSIGGLRSLEVLDLSENALTGNIPRNLGALNNLTSVSLRGNYFSGSIPGGFNRVRVLDLSSNLLNGSLPVDLGEKNFRALISRITGLPAIFLVISVTGYRKSEFGFLERESFAGNPDLCGPPTRNPCPIPSSPTSLPPDSDQPIPPPAFAAMPKTFASSPEMGPQQQNGPPKKNHGLRPHIIAAIVGGDLAGLAILIMVFVFIYKRKTNNNSNNTRGKIVNNNKSPASTSAAISKSRPDYLSSTSSSSLDSKESGRHQQVGKLVTVENAVDGELELETLLKASAYILGASGTSIMYKAVLEDGTVLAVRRVGESNSVEKFKEFEGHVRAIAKLVHPNLVKVRGFYWGSDEKLLIYEYVSNGSLANARYRKSGSSPCHIPWAVRLRIAKGVARGLSYIHEKKHVHGNLKPITYSWM
ncbi:hypothetical protein RDABS01_000550 [Bienertia sinuspersici]